MCDVLYPLFSSPIGNGECLHMVIYYIFAHCKFSNIKFLKLSAYYIGKYGTKVHCMVIKDHVANILFNY